MGKPCSWDDSYLSLSVSSDSHMISIILALVTQQIENCVTAFASLCECFLYFSLLKNVCAYEFKVMGLLAAILQGWVLL